MPKFPNRRDELYTQALNVVLTQWDEERGIKRNSTYGQLTPEKKQALLAWLAFETFSAGELFIPEARLTRLIADFWRKWLQQEVAEQKELYGELNWSELPPKNVDAKKIIREIVAQYGLLVEQLPVVYSFSHLTLQEYFTAQYIVENVSQDSLPRLFTHVAENSWREVFLLTAGMLFKATVFFEQFLDAVDYLVVEDAGLVAHLKWVTRKSVRLQSGVQPPAARAFFFFFYPALYLAPVLDLDLDLACDLSHDRDADFDLDVAHAHALVHNPTPADARARNNARAHVRAYARDFVLDVAVSYDLSLLTDLPKDIGGIVHHFQTHIPSAIPHWLKESVTELSVPDKKASVAEWQQLWTQLKAILLQYWGLQQFWQPTRAQAKLVTQYLTATHLLVQCLDVATVNREAVEARLLLPPKEGLENHSSGG